MNIGAIAKHISGALSGDQALEITGMANLAEARLGEIAFFRDAKYAQQLESTRASAVLVPADWDGVCPAPAIIKVTDPSAAFMRIGEFFAPPPVARVPGIHPSAIIDKSVKLGVGVHVGPYTVIEEGAAIGDHCIIEAQVLIGQHVTMGTDCHVYPQVTVREGSLLGNRVILHTGVRIGSDGYGYNPKVGADGKITIVKIPQIGIVELGDDVEVGSNTTIDRARFGRTKIGDSVKIDNLVQIGHNVQVGDYSGIIAQAGIAGSSIIGSGCIIWSQAGVSGHLTIGDRAQLGPASGLAKDIPAGEFYIGLPAGPRRELAASMLLPRVVDKLKKRVAELEDKVKELSQ
ncbi:MAG: UDP-3-O-(3-hydroxymyristoyl)glucosamine N-acyltransferase [Kiritimatiellia bacterium]